MEPTTVNSFLDQFIATADAGFGLIQGDVGFVLNALIIISITLAGAQWALAQQAPTWPLFRKVLFVGLFAFLVQNWNAIATAINSSGATLGLRAGGDGMSMADLHNPGRIAEIGVELYGKTIELGDGMNFFTDFLTLATIFLASVFVMLGFFVLALQIFCMLIAFKIGALAAFVALPWGVFNGTAWVAERPLGWVAACAIRLFVLALIASIAVSFVDTLPSAFSLEGGGVLNVLLFGLTILALAWFGPSLASEVMQGQPQLSGSDAVQTGLGAVGVGIGAGMGAIGTVRLGAGIAIGGGRLALKGYRAARKIGAPAKAQPAIDHSKFQPPAKTRGGKKS